jgi:hypothetical protein
MGEAATRSAPSQRGQRAVGGWCGSRPRPRRGGRGPRPASGHRGPPRSRRHRGGGRRERARGSARSRARWGPRRRRGRHRPTHRLHHAGGEDQVVSAVAVEVADGDLPEPAVGGAREVVPAHRAVARAEHHGAHLHVGVAAVHREVRAAVSEAQREHVADDEHAPRGDVPRGPPRGAVGVEAQHVAAFEHRAVEGAVAVEVGEGGVRAAGAAPAHAGRGRERRAPGVESHQRRPGVAHQHRPLSAGPEGGR